MKTALGIATVNRPAYFKALAKSVYIHLDCPVFVYNDGSDRRFEDRYKKAYRFLPDANIVHKKENHGVAHAKNRLLEMMLATDADWLILAEDDLKVLNKGAVEGYVQACQESGLHHLSFALHGPANIDENGQPRFVEETDITRYYFHSIGAWCIYSRECLEAVGLLDESFVNAWEHVELSCRLAAAGYTTGPFRWADVKWPQHWLTEQEGSIANSSIPQGPEHEANKRNGLLHWRETRPDTFDTMFGKESPLHNWAYTMVLGEAP